MWHSVSVFVFIPLVTPRVSLTTFSRFFGSYEKWDDMEADFVDFTTYYFHCAGPEEEETSPATLASLNFGKDTHMCVCSVGRRVDCSRTSHTSLVSCAGSTFLALLVAVIPTRVVV